MALNVADRVQQTGTANTTVSFTLSGSVAGFQSFAVVGNTNTTYYTATDASGNWEVGLGTYSTTGPTLTRTTILSSSNLNAAVTFSGTVNVFITYPAEKSVNQDANNRVLIPYTSGTTNVGSLNVGNATVHTDSGVIAGFTASEPLYLYTSLQNTDSGATSYASYAVNDGGHTAYGELGINNANYSYSTAGFPNNGFSIPLATFVESYGGPLVLGSWDNQKISFIVNGAVSTTDAMTINTNGSVAFNGQVGTAGQVLQSNATSAPTWVTSGTVGQGGTGQTTYTDGQLLIGNSTGNTLTKTTLTAGAGVSITNGSGSISIASPLAKSTSAFTTGTAQTYTAPANTQWVKITVVGPGGNGAGAAGARATGGGGGAVAIKWLAMTAGQTLTYTVGTTGTASTVASGTLTISTITANSGSNGTTTTYAASVTSGSAGGAATGGDVNITGGLGGNSYGSGTTVGTNFSGKGGDCPGFGSGGAAVALVATIGNVGQGYGAGAAGSHGSATTSAGSGGIIIFEAY